MVPPGAGSNPFLSPILARPERDPDALFGIFHHAETDEWREIRLDAFLLRALRFAGLYREAGVERGGRILLVVQHGLDAHAAFLGAMLAGAVPSFLPYPNAKQDDERYWQQHRAVFALVRPALILTYDELYGAVADCAKGVAPVVPLSGVEAAPTSASDRLPASEEVALLQHSSGTTGLKKGVALSYRSICGQIEAYATALELERVARPRIVSWLPLYHDMGLISSFLLPLHRGVPIVAMDPFDWVMRPSMFFDAVEQHRGTHAWLPNFAFLHLVRGCKESGPWDLSSLDSLVSCSEPCKPEAFDAFLTAFASSAVRPEVLRTCYAMAETVFAVSQSPAGRPVRRLSVDPVCIAELGEVRVAGDASLELMSNGPTVPGCEVAILRPGGFAGDRSIGEICVRAPFLFSGYHGNESATREAFAHGWYCTGDLGFLDRSEVFVVGRIKDTIIVNGKNVFAHDIEAAVSRVTGVKPGRAVAFGRYEAEIGSERIVVVAEREAGPEMPEAIARAINHIVAAETGLPCGDVRVVAPGWLVKTTSGKISRLENAKKYAATFRAPG